MRGIARLGKGGARRGVAERAESGRGDWFARRQVVGGTGMQRESGRRTSDISRLFILRISNSMCAISESRLSSASSGLITRQSTHVL